MSLLDILNIYTCENIGELILSYGKDFKTEQEEYLAWLLNPYSHKDNKYWYVFSTDQYLCKTCYNDCIMGWTYINKKDDTMVSLCLSPTHFCYYCLPYIYCNQSFSNTKYEWCKQIGTCNSCGNDICECNYSTNKMLCDQCLF